LIFPVSAIFKSSFVPLYRKIMQKNEEFEILNYRPQFFRCDNIEEMKKFHSFSTTNNITQLDLLEDQINDLLPCLYPSDYFAKTSPNLLLSKWLDGRNIDFIGNWVYFSWKNTAVRLLEKSDFITCRTNRNLLKIEPATQQKLEEKKIIFIGLSVGQSAALTFAQQRIGGTLYLADFDTLSLTNMNRLRASVADLGLKKTIIAARMIAELDPYLEVICIHDGASEENLMALLTQNGNGKIDLVVEECDSLDIKFSVREIAQKLGISVIMETSDRGMLDIERFDLDNQRPLFHGLVPGITAEKIRSMGPQEKFQVLAQIVDYENISPGLKKSYAALGSQILTWPQLAYEVNLGGSSLAYAGFSILADKTLESGRYYVDLEQILANGPCNLN